MSIRSIGLTGLAVVGLVGCGRRSGGSGPTNGKPELTVVYGKTKRGAANGRLAQLAAVKIHQIALPAGDARAEEEPAAPVAAAGRLLGHTLVIPL